MYHNYQLFSASKNVTRRRLVLHDEVSGGESNPGLGPVDDEWLGFAEVGVAVDVDHVVEGREVVSFQLFGGKRDAHTGIMTSSQES